MRCLPELEGDFLVRSHRRNGDGAEDVVDRRQCLYEFPLSAYLIFVVHFRCAFVGVLRTFKHGWTRGENHRSFQVVCRLNSI